MLKDSLAEGRCGAHDDCGHSALVDSDPMVVVATGCGVMHQYNGNDICGSRCTLTFAHDGSHVCGNGHSF